MKHINTHLLVLFSFLCTSAFAQQSKEKVFSCNQSAVQDEHSTDSTFNALIDAACQEINFKNYEMGLKLLNEAILKDSIYSASSGGAMNEYIKAQRNKLKIFIDNQKLDQAENQNENIKAGQKPEVKQQESTLVNESKNAETQSKIPEPAPSEPKPVIAAAVATPAIASSPEVKTSGASKPSEPDPFTEKPQPVPIIEETKTFSKEELEEFQMKGMQKVKILEMYLVKIASQNTSAPDADVATESAISLFDSEERYVEVSSLNNQSKILKVRKYFQKLRMLPYDRIMIEWADLQYTGDFRKGVDGNYYGYIIFRQRFVAEKDNQVVYEDLTTKKSEVILKSYNKSIEGQAIENWDVFLGDIRVQQTEAN